MDLGAQFACIGGDIRHAVLAVLESGEYVQGPKVASFEQAFASSLGVRHCVGVNSGTSALHLALHGAGIGPGDEVLLPAMTFVSTAWAVSYLGATPVFVDVDPITYTLDVDEARRRITPRTRAIVPVHLYGQPADMEALLAIGRSHDVLVIEDAAQAHGALVQGAKAGSLGRCGCFSFYPGKNLGGCGEAGAVVTNDDRLAARLRALRNHGQTARHIHDEIGYNYRMDAIQAAVLEVKLRHLDEWTLQRRARAERYRGQLADLPLTLPVEAADRRHAWHLYVVLSSRRDEILQAMASRAIHGGLHYPVPVPLQPAYRHLGYAPGDFPVAERIARECLSLPLFPELLPEQQDRVIDVLRTVLSREACA